MALADPIQLLFTFGLIIAVPVIVLYWIVRLAVRHELKQRNSRAI